MGDTWYLDELFVNIQSRRQYLWRAVDQDGDVMDVLVQSRRDRQAAARFFHKLLKGQGCEPRRLIRAAPVARGRAVSDHVRYPSSCAGYGCSPIIGYRESVIRSDESASSCRNTPIATSVAALVDNRHGITDR